MHAPDSHVIYVDKDTIETPEDSEGVFARAMLGEIKLIYRQKTYSLLGYQRYIYYWAAL